MAGEEEVELRDLVAQTLEAKGVLGKIRAELRASVFLALEEQEAQQKPHPLVNQKLQQYLKTKDGQAAASLVREFLEFFNLDFTAAVFDPESNVMESYPGRARLAKDFGIDPTPALPLLASIVQKAAHHHHHHHHSFPPHTSSSSSSSQHASSSQLAQAAVSLSATSDQPPLLSNSLEPEEPRSLNGQLNTNENSNLQLSYAPMTLLNPEVAGDTNRLTLADVERTPLADLSLGSKPGGGVVTELGDPSVGGSPLVNEGQAAQGQSKEKEKSVEGKAAAGGGGGASISKEKTSSGLEKHPPLHADPGMKPGGGLSSLKDLPSLSLPPFSSSSSSAGTGFGTRTLEEKLKELGLDTVLEEEEEEEEAKKSDVGNESITEDMSLPTTGSGKFETEDISIFSQNSLTGDFDHAEAIQT